MHCCFYTSRLFETVNMCILKYKENEGSCIWNPRFFILSFNPKRSLGHLGI